MPRYKTRGKCYSDASEICRLWILFRSVPRTSISEKADGTQDFELNDDPAAAKYLDVRHCPIFVTLSQVGQDGSLFVVDANSEEDSCACCSISVGAH
jgi:exosome complex RNA-binding protein Rrp42 (RNase PH superfamily)